MGTNRQVIRPQVDVPIIFRLDRGPEGTEKQSDKGIDYQYIVNNDAGILWIQKEGRDAILRSGAKQGDDVQLCKAMRGKQVYYNAQVVSETHEPAPRNGYQPNYENDPFAPPANGGPRLVGNYQAGSSTQQRAQQAQQQQAALAKHIAAAHQPNGYPNGLSYAEAMAKPISPPSPAPAPKPFVPTSSLGKLMGHYLCSALEAVQQGEMYARNLGSNIEFQSDDVRAIAITLFIEDARRARDLEAR